MCARMTATKTTPWMKYLAHTRQHSRNFFLLSITRSRPSSPLFVCSIAAHTNNVLEEEETFAWLHDAAAVAQEKSFETLPRQSQLNSFISHTILFIMLRSFTLKSHRTWHLHTLGDTFNVHRWNSIFTFQLRRCVSRHKRRKNFN